MFMSNKNHESDSKKIEELYYKYRSIMYKEAYKILQDSGLSEDAVQQAFIKVMRNLDKINMDDEYRTRGFLIIISKHTAIDIYKKRLYLNNNSEPFDYELDDEIEVSIDFDEPSKLIVDKETVSGVISLIEKLPEIYKDVLLLEKVHGNAKEEIAELLGINYETVKKRSLRARKMLLELLEKEELK